MNLEVESEEDLVQQWILALFCPRKVLMNVSLYQRPVLVYNPLAAMLV